MRRCGVLFSSAATLAAMTGTILGNRLLKKITLRLIQIIEAKMLFIISIALGMGLFWK